MRLIPLVAAWLLGAPPHPAGPLQPVGRLDHPAIAEASGIVQSRRHPGTFWVHNDSGNPPALFAVRRDGSLLREFAVAVPNVDWEDIATDSEGHLYLGDIGNNGLHLPLRAVYQLDEPDPARPPSGPVAVRRASFYRFPATGRFDAEGLVVTGKAALIVAKAFDRREAELFEVPLDPPGSLLQPAVAKRVGSLPGFREPATGADLSPDGRRLAVCALDVARVYESRGPGSWALIGEAHYPAEGKGIEAICWDGDDLILAGEGREIDRIAESAWRRLGSGRSTGRAR